jgi:hypothetical protein
MEPTSEAAVAEYQQRQAETAPHEHASFVGLDPIYLAVSGARTTDFVYEQNLGGYLTRACLTPLHAYLNPNIDTLWKRPDVTAHQAEPTRVVTHGLKRNARGHVSIDQAAGRAESGATPPPLARLYPRDPMMLPPFFNTHNVSEMFDFTERRLAAPATNPMTDDVDEAGSHGEHKQHDEDAERAHHHPDGQATIFGFPVNGELHMHQLVAIIWSLGSMLLYDRDECKREDEAQKKLWHLNPLTNLREFVRHPGMPGGCVCCPIGAGKTLIALSMIMCLHWISTHLRYEPPARLAHVKTIPQEVDERIQLDPSDPQHIPRTRRMEMMRVLARENLVMLMQTHYNMTTTLVYRQSHYRHFFDSYDRLAAIQRAEQELAEWEQQQQQQHHHHPSSSKPKWKSELLTELCESSIYSFSLVQVREECQRRKQRVLADLRAELILYPELFNHIRLMENQLKQLAEETIVRIMPFFYELKDLPVSPIHQSPSLIICSLTLLSNWQCESFRFFGHRLRILIVLSNPSKFTAGINYEGFVRVVSRSAFRAADLKGRHVVLTNVEAWNRFHHNQDNMTKAQKSKKANPSQSRIAPALNVWEERECMRLFRKGKCATMDQVRRVMHGPDAQNERIFGVCQDLRSHPEYHYGRSKVATSAPSSSSSSSSATSSSSSSSSSSTTSHSVERNDQSFFDFFNTTFQLMAVDESQGYTLRTENSAMATLMDISATGRFCFTGTIYTHNFDDILRQMMVSGFDSHHIELQNVCRSNMAGASRAHSTAAAAGTTASFGLRDSQAKQQNMFLYRQMQDAKLFLDRNITTSVLQMSQEAFRTKVLKVDCIPLRLEVDNFISDDPALMPPQGVAVATADGSAAAAGGGGGGGAGAAPPTSMGADGNALAHPAIPLVFPVIPHSHQQIARVRNCYLRTRRALNFDAVNALTDINRNIKHRHFTTCPMTASAKLPNYYARVHTKQKNRVAIGDDRSSTRKKAKRATGYTLQALPESDSDTESERKIEGVDENSGPVAAATGANARKRKQNHRPAATESTESKVDNEDAEDEKADDEEEEEADEEKAMLTNFSDLRIQAETRQTFDLRRPSEQERKRDHDCLVYIWSLLRDQGNEAAEGFLGYYFDKFTVEVDYILARLDEDDRVFADAWKAFTDRKIASTEFEGQRDDPTFVLPTLSEIDLDTRLAWISEFYTTPGVMPMAEKFIVFTSSRASLIMFRQRLDAELRRRDMIKIQSLLQSCGLLQAMRDGMEVGSAPSNGEGSAPSNGEGSAPSNGEGSAPSNSPSSHNAGTSASGGVGGGSAPSGVEGGVALFMRWFRELYYAFKTLGGLSLTAVLHPKLDIGATMQKLNTLREIRVLLCTYHIGKTGINAQVINHVVNHDDDTSFLGDMQATGRAYRQGQTRDVMQVTVTRNCHYERAYRKRLEDTYQQSRELLRTTSKSASRDFYANANRLTSSGSTSPGSTTASTAAASAASAFPSAAATAASTAASASLFSSSSTIRNTAVTDASIEGLDTDEDEWNQSNAYAIRQRNQNIICSVLPCELRARRWSSLFVSSMVRSGQVDYFKECSVKSRNSVRFPLQRNRPMRLYSSFFYFHIRLPCTQRDAILKVLRFYQATFSSYVQSQLSTPTAKPIQQTLAFILKHSLVHTLQTLDLTGTDRALLDAMHAHVSVHVVLLDKSDHTPDHERWIVGRMGPMGPGGPYAPTGGPIDPYTMSPAYGNTTPLDRFMMRVTMHQPSESPWLFLSPHTMHDAAMRVIQRDSSLPQLLADMCKVPAPQSQLDLHSTSPSEITRFKQMLGQLNQTQDTLEQELDQRSDLATLREGVFVCLRKW